MGCLPDVYTGYQKVLLPEAQAKFAAAWGRTPGPVPGRTVNRMLEGAISGDVRAMYIMGENPMVSDPDIAHVRAALESLEFLAVSDIFMSETAQLADVVLPATSWLEKEGTFTATDRRIQRFYQAMPPVGDSRTDAWIICELAERLKARIGFSTGAPLAGWDYAGPAEIMDEIAALTPIYGGVRHERLVEHDLQWPCPSIDHPGTPYLHKGKFSRGLGHFTPVYYIPPAEETDAEYPLLFTTGRSAFHWHSGTMTRRTDLLDQEVPECYVEINPADADRLGIRKTSMVRLTSRRGTIEAQAWITKRVPAGVVFAPFHFAEAAANALTNPSFDPKSGIPDYKVCAVRLELAPQDVTGQAATQPALTLQKE